MYMIHSFIYHERTHSLHKKNCLEDFGLPAWLLANLSTPFMTGRWFQVFFCIFIPENWGFMIQFDDCAYFSDGLVKNHQVILPP